MTAWETVYGEIAAFVQGMKHVGCDVPYFRGHSNAEWKLLPGLGRSSHTKKQLQDTENRIYYDFISLGGPLASVKYSTWETLFAMQHHGLPTRLLDWTSNFAVALYFATFPDPSSTGSAAIWVLNPYQLNKICVGERTIPTPPADFQGDYYDNFIVKSKTLGHRAVAINPTRINARQLAQDSTFVLFDDLKKPLEQIVPKAVKKFILPDSAKWDALEFLQMAGINEHKLFPDLDGIARFIRRQHWP